MKKSVDIIVAVEYTNWAVAREQQNKKELEKKFKNKWKKLLTNTNGCVIINKLSLRQQQMNIDNWTINHPWNFFNKFQRTI